jgi:hypothetical protein
MPRFVLLEHVGHPEDPSGRHFDLLLEMADACRTWRLEELPGLGAGPVAAMPLPDHRLAWLDRLEGEVSGGRGFARRVDAGVFRTVTAPTETGAATVLKLYGRQLRGQLTIAAASAVLEAPQA